MSLSGVGSPLSEALPSPAMPSGSGAAGAPSSSSRMASTSASRRASRLWRSFCFSALRTSSERRTSFTASAVTRDVISDMGFSRRKM
ncbi:hypothetical protein [Escherichia Stx1 converting phage]|nr:hypothetical protein Stx1_p152 [Escherichia Stx1 converting phage]BAC77968.1 hypothetical protein [Escherichia Stx1 converting phage]